MKAQHREELVYNDQVYYLATEPLKGSVQNIV